MSTPLSDGFRAANVDNVAGDEPLAHQVARILRAARGDRPRAQIARLLGVNANSIREVEVGYQRSKKDGQPEPTNLTLKRLEEIADAYGVRLVVIAVPAGVALTVPGDAGTGPTVRDDKPPAPPAVKPPSPPQAPPAARASILENAEAARDPRLLQRFRLRTVED